MRSRRRSKRPAPDWPASSTAVKTRRARMAWPSGSKGDDAGELLEQTGPATGAHHALAELSLAEHQDRRQAHDVVAPRQLRPLVRVHLAHAEPVRIVDGDRIENR